MSLGQRLELRQTAQLVMTPQLQQAIRLLQMSAPELQAFVAEEVEKNPILGLDTGERETAAPPARSASPLETQLRDAAPGRAEATLDAPRDGLYDEAVADTQVAWSSVRDPAPAGGPLSDLGERLERPASLREHLLDQIGLMRAPALPRAAAAALTGELDETGYLTRPLTETATQIGVPLATLEAGLALLQDCEPTGIGARSLAECLALQLRARDRLDPAMQAVLDNLPLLADARYDRLMALAGIDREDLDGILSEIRGLDPRPGRAFGGMPAQSVVPDILVRRDGIGAWGVSLNPEAMPRLLIDRSYAARVEAGGGDAAAYIQECRAGATWLTRTLESRARTILAVATELVRYQNGFFSAGIPALRPLTLRAVAETVGLHESTVSRVTAGKYLACERGIYELRFFFSQGITASDGGEALSSTAVRERIRRMIAEEDPAKVLSDDTIVARLRKEGVDIARRTVAKYRESMAIPSSVKRRRLKAGRPD